MGEGATVDVVVVREGRGENGGVLMGDFVGLGTCSGGRGEEQREEGAGVGQGRWGQRGGDSCALLQGVGVGVRLSTQMPRIQPAMHRMHTLVGLGEP